MSDMQRYPFNLAANGSQILQVMGTSFIVLSATGALSARMDQGGALVNITAGMGKKGREFTGLTLTDLSGAPNSGFILVSDDEFLNQTFSGSVSVTALPNVTIGAMPSVVVSSMPVPMTGAMASAAATVTNASGQLKAANAARKYLLIQNNDASGTIYVQPSAAAATAANGIKIGPGGYWEPVIIPTSEIRAIGSIASNANIVVVEG
ncbi:MAG: hypothetical protein NDJ19_00655 [Ramlibacter sp.]|nr:hypothetical protein [Ramlibacter sp.]